MINIMTDADLAVIGMTREEWNKNMDSELDYVEEWASGVNSNDL